MLKYLKLLSACLHKAPCALPDRSAADGSQCSCTKANGAIMARGARLTNSTGKPSPLLHSDHKQETCASTFSGLSWTQRTLIPKGQSDNESVILLCLKLSFLKTRFLLLHTFSKLSFTSFLRSF